MNKKTQHLWDINLTETNNFLIGIISHYVYIDKDATNNTCDLVEQLGDKGVQNLLMDSIISIIPDVNLVLNTPGPGNQYWFKTPKKKLIKRFLNFFIGFYLSILYIFRFIFNESQKLKRHIRDIQKYLNQEISKVYLDELYRDNIHLIKNDKLDHYYIELKKEQLPKYLDAFGDYGGVPENFDTIFTPKDLNNLLKEEDINFIKDILISREYSKEKIDIARIKLIMNNNIIIGIFFEGCYYYITHLSSKENIVNQLKKVASRYNLIINLY